MGITELEAPATSTAEERVSNVEISLVLDISSSMLSNRRFTNLKPAARTFVDTRWRYPAASSPMMTQTMFTMRCRSRPHCRGNISGNDLQKLTKPNRLRQNLTFKVRPHQTQREKAALQT